MRQLGKAVKMSLRRRRRAAAVIELVFMLVPFTILNLAMIDMGLGVFRYHIVTQAARHVARRAIVRGAAGTPLGIWGPGEIDELVTVDDIPAIDDPQVGVRSRLIACNLAVSRLRIQWPDADNGENDDVVVTITTVHQPIMSWIYAVDPITLTGVSRMQIAH